MSDFLDVKRREINERLKELRPLVDEYNQLESAAAALASVTTGGKNGTTKPRAATPAAATLVGATPAAATKAPARKRTRTAARRPGRRRGSGTRAAQALTLVQSNPGIAIPDLADKMGIKQNYLYRVLPGLEQDGKVKRDGRGWHATTNGKKS